MEQALTLRVVLVQPPEGVDFGLQVGHGAVYETVQKQRSDGNDIRFEFSVSVKASDKRTAPDFSGKVVQGRRGERFVYIDIGTCAGQTGTPWSRRLKIPLKGITWSMIDRSPGASPCVLETRVPGTGRDGGPNCATVKPFDGWKLGTEKDR